MIKEDMLLEKINQSKISRRKFLILSQQVLFSSSALSLCSFSLQASDIDDLKLKLINSNEGLLLANVSRLLFPHDDLQDTVYLEVVRDIEADMVTSENVRVMIRQAVVELNKKTEGQWFTTLVDVQLDILKSLQSKDWFNYLRNRTIESLYRNSKVWELLGYQGSSVEHGGYLHRGFDDINWLE
ncbi:MAG: hypothetical protein ACI9SC_003286 [Gammaproteobacteria bacterium]|jgi:hypothetical protein